MTLTYIIYVVVSLFMVAVGFGAYATWKSYDVGGFIAALWYGMTALIILGVIAV